MPTNIVIESAAINSMVVAAFLASGGLKAGTPLDTASTPVMAVHPVENAVSTRNSASGWVRVNRVAIREDHDGENRRDDEGDWLRIAERGDAHQDEHAQNFFGRVRDRRQRVGRQDREAREPGEALVMREMGRNRLPDQ